MNNFAVLVFFLPICIFCQSDSTVSPNELDPQCVEDFKKMKGCMNDPKLITKVSNIPYSDSSTDDALLQEVQAYYDCLGGTMDSINFKCENAKILTGYIHQTTLYLNDYKAMDSCLGNGTLGEVLKTCASIPRPPEPVDDPCEQWKDKCLVSELNEVEKCSRHDVGRFTLFATSLALRCELVQSYGHQWDQYLGSH